MTRSTPDDCPSPWHIDGQDCVKRMLLGTSPCQKCRFVVHGLGYMLVQAKMRLGMTLEEAVKS